MSGLLGDAWDDPKTLATLQLAAGLLGPGGFGTGLGRGLVGYQGLLQSQAETQRIKATAAAMAQEAAIREVQLAQSQRMFNLQTPFLEEALRRMQEQGGGQAVAAAPPDTSLAGPSVMAGSGPAPSFASSNRMMGGTAPASAAPSVASTQGQMFPGVPDSVAFSTIGTGGFAKLPELIAKYNEPTDVGKMLIAQGIAPGSPEWNAAFVGKIKKETFIPPTPLRSPQYIDNATGQVRQVPMAIEGSMWTPDPRSPTGYRYVGTPGAPEAIRSIASAQAGGKAAFTPYAGYTESGPAPVRSVAEVLAPASPSEVAAALPVSTPDSMGPDRYAGVNGSQLAAADLKAARNALLSAKSPAEKTILQAEVNRIRAASVAAKGPVFGSLPPGTTENAANNANELSKKWSAQIELNQQAQTTNSYLDSIEQLSKTAGTGPFSDKIALANALLAPFSTKRAEALTAKQLLDKYQNQIVSRLGIGGLGTDQARAILESAYPNSKMTPEAIADAAANLRGAQAMVQSRTALLRPITADRSPDANAKYDAAATNFDQLADPRLFQLKNMTAEQAQKYLAAMPASVRSDLAVRAAKLKEMGVF